MPARVGIAGRAAGPMIRSLSPRAVDLGRVEEGDAGVDGGVPRLFDRCHGSDRRRSRPSPRSTGRPRPRCPHRAGEGDVRTGQVVVVRDHGCTVPVHEDGRRQPRRRLPGDPPAAGPPSDGGCGVHLPCDGLVRMDSNPRPLRCAVIGAGMAGILSAIKLAEAGLDRLHRLREGRPGGRHLAGEHLSGAVVRRPLAPLLLLLRPLPRNGATASPPVRRSSGLLRAGGRRVRRHPTRSASATR